MEEILFTEKEIYEIERYLLSSYSGNISEKDEIYQVLKKILTEECRNNNIEYNNESFRNIIKRTKNSVINKENIKKFLCHYFSQMEEKQEEIFEEVSRLDTNFDNIDSYETFKNEFLNQISSLSPVSKLFMIECLTNIDIMHNPTTSYAGILNEEIALNLPGLSSFFMKFLNSHIKIEEYSNNSVEDNQVNTNVNDFDENVENGFGDFDFSELEELTPEWEIYSENEVSEAKEENNNESLKNMMEFYLTLPSISKNLGYLKRLNAELFKEKEKIFYNTVKSLYPEYIEQLQTIMNHNKETNRYYYHGAASDKIANQIMQDGLYMQYSDINRTAKPELDTVELLNYSYGHDGVGRHVVVIIDQPNNEYVVQRDNVGKLVSGTGQGLAGANDFKANYVIPIKYIVGYVDKYNKKIVYNPKYYKFQSNQIFASQQADQMIQAMINGQLDTNGQPIIPNEEQMTSGRHMGFVNVKVLGIIVTIISIGAIVSILVLNLR